MGLSKHLPAGPGSELELFGSHPGVQEGDLPLLVRLCVELIMVPTSQGYYED